MFSIFSTTSQIVSSDILQMTQRRHNLPQQPCFCSCISHLRKGIAISQVPALESSKSFENACSRLHLHTRKSKTCWFLLQHLLKAKASFYAYFITGSGSQQLSSLLEQEPLFSLRFIISHVFSQTMAYLIVFLQYFEEQSF